MLIAAAGPVNKKVLQLDGGAFGGEGPCIDLLPSLPAARADRPRRARGRQGLLHGAAARVDRNATAFGLREDQWDYDVISQWTDPAESAGHIQWTRDFWTAVEPFATGEVYVNHLDAEEATRIRAAYGPGYERLVALKNKYDPTNLFRLNQNIKPTV